MGCSCKNKVNKKYLDKDEIGNEEVERINGFAKMGNFIAQFLFGLLVSLILIIGLIPLFCYVIFCVCTGKDMKFTIPNVNKWLKRN